MNKDDGKTDALLAQALAMICIGQHGHLADVSPQRFEAVCDGMVISMTMEERTSITVDDGFSRVLQADWNANETDDARVSAFLPGTWEGRLFEIARPSLGWKNRRHWKRHQRRRAA
jgi:hypothetical protein